LTRGLAWKGRFFGRGQQQENPRNHEVPGGILNFKKN
jgi:hypothetical protein